MSRRTETKKLRTMDWDKDRGLYRKEVSDPPQERRHIGDCWICHLPVYTSPGQRINIGTQTFRDGKIVTVYAHKLCRKLEKRGKI